MKPKATVRYSKLNVFIRDNFRCAYCNIEVTTKTATIDHVLPLSHGGNTTFENTVCACSVCNSSKGNNKKIIPKIKPSKPSYFQLSEQRKKMGWKVAHPEWLDYIV
jgi:5-methylcytosine-specific restriction endonuclease McrA